ncbi:hypothetical protein GALMADRAFT_213117 [Galerina marginata CBS 339.88]|uniref:N-acetyltransferase domain-containing protein n=1 Tax=Galerina marginata (strain CBS 339.88) TaxID=685588 RepID=A0A067SY18_GALM3|nr:hypothetical protein GALMADRAFT_213117 [Galerina marginata CBS 339.88]
MPVDFTPVKAPVPAQRVIVTKGLEGQDDNIDLLQSYFKEMQKTTVETATIDDFLSFATCAHYFGVISLVSSPEPLSSEESGDEDAEGEPEEASEDVSESAYPASSRPTASGFHQTIPSPPVSSVANSTEEEESEEDIYAAFAALSEQEKILRWREAFMAKLEEAEPIVPPSRFSDSDDEMDSYTDKGKAREISGPFLVPHDQGSYPSMDANINEIPDDFINWPDDMPGDDDGTKTMANEGPSSSNEPLANLQIYSMIEPVVVDKEFGREYLEPEQYDTPVPELPELPVDPKFQAFIYDSAIKYRDELRARTIADYEKKKRARQAAQAARPLPASPASAKKEVVPIGVIYLWTSQNFEDPLHVGEYSMGFYIAPDYRKREYLVDALNDVVKQAFNDHQCHRLQSIIVENNDKLYTLQLLAAAGFRHEGTRRRAFFSSIDQEWKDVTYLAMLATEWVYDNNNSSSSVRLRTSSLWDEILARHQRELDDLQRLEERTLKRSTSTETIRQRLNTAVDFNLTDSETQSITSAEMSPSSSSFSGAKRRRVDPGNVGSSSSQRRDSFSSGSGLGSEWEVPRSPNQPTTSGYSRTRNASGTSANPGTARHRKKSSGGLSFSSASSSSSSSNWVVTDQ